MVKFEKEKKVENKRKSGKSEKKKKKWQENGNTYFQIAAFYPSSLTCSVIVFEIVHLLNVRKFTILMDDNKEKNSFFGEKIEPKFKMQ